MSVAFGFLAAHAERGNTIGYTNEGIHEVETNHHAEAQNRMVSEGLMRGHSTPD